MADEVAKTIHDDMQEHVEDARLVIEAPIATQFNQYIVSAEVWEAALRCAQCCWKHAGEKPELERVVQKGIDIMPDATSSMQGDQKFNPAFPVPGRRRPRKGQ